MSSEKIALFPSTDIDALRDKLRRLADTAGNGNPPGGGDMETRIINLERDMTDVKVAMGRVETRLGHIEQMMLTKGQMAIYALAGAMIVLGGGWWIVQQYLAPILARLPSAG